jgi:hypothetical protein
VFWGIYNIDMTEEPWASGVCHFVREHQRASPLVSLKDAFKKVRELCYTILLLSLKKLCCISTSVTPINNESGANRGIALVKARRLCIRSHLFCFILFSVLEFQFRNYICWASTLPLEPCLQTFFCFSYFF